MGKSKKIGEKIKIKAGLYRVVKGNEDSNKFLAFCSMRGYLITSFKMAFGEQEGIYVEKNRVLVKDGIIIELENKE